MDITFEQFEEMVNVRVIKKLGMSVADLPDIYDLHTDYECLTPDMTASEIKQAAADAAYELVSTQYMEMGMDLDEACDMAS